MARMLLWSAPLEHVLDTARERCQSSTVGRNSLHYTRALLELTFNKDVDPDAPETRRAVIDYIKEHLKRESTLTDDDWANYHEGVMTRLRSDKPLTALAFSL